MIHINDAIESEAWLLFDIKDYETNYKFQIKIKAFERVDLSTIDFSQCRAEIDEASNIWIIQLDVVNLCKQQADIKHIKRNLILIDGDGFEFKSFEDRRFQLPIQYEYTSGLVNFYNLQLNPKIKRSGAILFELPDIFENISIGIIDGTLTKL